MLQIAKNFFSILLIAERNNAMITRITPKIKNLIGLGITSTLVAAVPLKSTQTKYISHSIKNIPQTTNLIELLNIRNAPISSFIDSAIATYKPRNLNVNSPIVPKPSLNMDISTTRYEGNPKFLEAHLLGVLSGKSQAFYNAQEKYGINATFLIGIANQESGYGLSAVAKKYNNIGGMRTSKGYIKYKSVEECIDSIASNLQRNYVQKGLKTPPQIGKKYCETAAWPKAIVSQMNKIHQNSKCQVFGF